MVAHATLLWGSRRRMGTAEDLRSRGASKEYLQMQKATAPSYIAIYNTALKASMGRPSGSNGVGGRQPRVNVNRAASTPFVGLTSREHSTRTTSLQQFKRRGSGEQPRARLGPSRLRHARVERE